jgi:hypothetical protein
VNCPERVYREEGGAITAEASVLKSMWCVFGTLVLLALFKILQKNLKVKLLGAVFANAHLVQKCILGVMYVSSCSND